MKDIARIFSKIRTTTEKNVFCLITSAREEWKFIFMVRRPFNWLEIQIFNWFEMPKPPLQWKTDERLCHIHSISVPKENQLTYHIKGQEIFGKQNLFGQMILPMEKQLNDLIWHAAINFSCPLRWKPMMSRPEILKNHYISEVANGFLIPQP